SNLTPYVDTISSSQFCCHVKIQPVAGVILHHVKNACSTVHRTCGGEHLVRNWGGKNGTRTGGVKHTKSDEASVHRLVAAATARNNTYFALNRRILAHDNLLLDIDTNKVRVSG